MCILFVAISDNPKDDGYQVIIANNRDEYFERPTKPAGFWNDDPHCISGLDQKAGKEGGTWLSLSTQNKIGVLLNIQVLSKDGGTDTVGTKKGRGFLVTDFMSTPKTARDYITSVERDGDTFYPFNLALLEKSANSDRWRLHYCNNEDQHSHEVWSNGIHGIGNSTIHKPWNKVKHGINRMETIISQFKAAKNKTNRKEELKIALLDLLNDDKSHLPDPQLESQLPQAWQKSHSAIFVKPTEGIRCGTRTNTVVIIDSEGLCEYVDRTMEDSINADSVKWTTSNYIFQMDYKNSHPKLDRMKLRRRSSLLLI
ncbi:unnamed protein product [Owenia fusiformis]|uniref:Uncharacterized protein n=1 Tax=Owenia fusiformis TaxID=6347 RepID=A0A8J1UX79_OWEFU|nr:unnamed protein product [Owenia fusiformis]